jgi:uncharacterized protein YbjT (DUF2867 family)
MVSCTYPMAVLVIGATGRIGQPVTRLLIERGHRVRAGVRDVASPAAAQPHAEIVRADFDDQRSLEAAVRGAAAVVAAGTAHRAGPDGERRHGLALAEAVARAGGPPLVYVSGAGADRPSDVPVFESKRAVEKRIAELGLAATVLAPAYFMENAFNPWNLDALARGRFPMALAPDRPLAQIAIDDVAAMAVLAVERFGQLVGQRIELASDELTGEQAAERLSRATGRRFTYERVDAPPPLRPLFAWLDTVGFGIDLAALHERYPEVGWRSFEAWARSSSAASVLQPCSAQSAGVPS